MVLSAAFESLTVHMLLIRLPGEGGKSTLTCKDLKCLAYARCVFVSWLCCICQGGAGWSRSLVAEGRREDACGPVPEEMALRRGLREMGAHGKEKGGRVPQTRAELTPEQPS